MQAGHYEGLGRAAPPPPIRAPRPVAGSRVKSHPRVKSFCSGENCILPGGDPGASLLPPSLLCPGQMESGSSVGPERGRAQPCLRPALPRGPSASFIDRQIRRPGPWRFQRPSQAPCGVAGIRARLTAWTPNKPGAAFLAASLPDRGGGWGARRGHKLGSKGGLVRPGAYMQPSPRGRRRSGGDLRTSGAQSWTRSWRAARTLAKKLGQGRRSVAVEKLQQTPL